MTELVFDLPLFCELCTFEIDCVSFFVIFCLPMLSARVYELSHNAVIMSNSITSRSLLGHAGGSLCK